MLSSRSQSSKGRKADFAARMEKTQRDLAVKKLEKEIKDEKAEARARSVQK